MRRPATVDPALATALLDIAVQPFPHASDAFFAALAVLVRWGLPLNQAEAAIPLPHPILRRGVASWNHARGGTWLLDTDTVRLEESARERALGASPLRSGAETIHIHLIDTLEATQRERWAHPDADMPLPQQLPLADGRTMALANLIVDADVRALFGFVRTDGRPFSEPELNLVQTMVWAFTPIARAARARGIAHTIATTYIGPVTGRRVLAGELRRGHMDRRTAVVWFSDLRGFTAMAEAHSPEEVSERLSVMFQHVAGAIHDAGGEVLKFIGDAILAIFPYCDESGAAEATAQALRAADACAQLPLGLVVGVGLNRGELAYGNVGAPDRLDFTVIGRTVNLAHRVEGLTSALHTRVLATAAVAKCAPNDFVSRGMHRVKGVADPLEVFMRRE